MDAEIEKLFSPLAASARAIPVDQLSKWLQTSNVDVEVVEKYVRFHPDRYLRNLMYAGPGFHALVLCWRAGQRSAIHDHSGSGCAVKVLRGIATETTFERAPNGMIYATSSRTLAEGRICASVDTDIHQISNLQANGADLITLHLYSPPLLSMNAYSIEEHTVTRFFDPINEDFGDGSGI